MTEIKVKFVILFCLLALPLAVMGQTSPISANANGDTVVGGSDGVNSNLDPEKLLENAEKQGLYLKEQLKQLQVKYPVIGDIRGIGLMVGIEFIKDERKTPDAELRDKLIQKAFERGLLLLGAGISSIRLAPPLIVKREELNIGLDILKDCLDELT